MLKKNYQRKLGSRGVANAPTKGMKRDDITNREQAKMLGYEGLHEWLHKPPTIAIYTGNAPFVAAVAVFDTKYQNNKDLSPLTHTDNTGYSVTAMNALNAMAKKAAILSGLGQVKLEIDGNLDEAGKFHIFENFYNRGAYEKCIKNGKDARKLLFDNIDDLTGYVVLTDLTDPGGLDELIGACESAVGENTSVHELEPVDTDKFKKSFKPADKAMRTLDNLSRFNDDFHTQVLKLTAVPRIAIQHTVVSVKVTDKITKQPIEGATGVLSVSSEVGSSDYLGEMFFEHVRNGPNRTLLISAANHKDVLMHIGINQGQDNHFDVEMEPGVSPV
jgi:hypothetical protein